jgi:hypothetical protein
MDPIFDTSRVTGRNTKDVFSELVATYDQSGQFEDHDDAVKFATYKLGRFQQEVGNDLEQLQTKMMLEIARYEDI